jgi:hypothetical protein
MEEGNLAILVDAKTEYTKQLVNILKNSLYIGIKEIYVDSKENCLENENDILSVFQVNLSEIPKWNQDIINTKTDSVIKDSGCDWIEDLITAVFVSHTRILTSINFSKNKKKINLKIPKVDHFIHQCYVDVARYFWKNPYLYDDDITSYEYQRNRREAEHIIENSIGETIRKQLPVKHILKEYLGNEYNEEESGDGEDITKNLPEKYQENLRKMVKAEIIQCSQEQDKGSIDLGEDIQTEPELKSTEPELKSTEPELKSTESVSEPTIEIVEPVVVQEPDINPAIDNEESKNDTEALRQASTTSETTPAPPNKEPEITTTTLDAIPNTTPSGISITSTVSNDDETNVNIESSTSNIISEKEPDSPIIPGSDVNLDNMINTELNAELNNVKKDDNLIIEELDLDMDDLSNLEEVYIDRPSSTPPSYPEVPANISMTTEQIDLNEFSTNESSTPSTPEPSEKNGQVKTIVLDTNEEIRKQLKRKDYSFFDDANED